MNNNQSNTNYKPSPHGGVGGGSIGGGSSLPRGLRNNNPLNIRLTKDKWLGQKNSLSDSNSKSSPLGGVRGGSRETTFCQFLSLAYGFRAAFVIIHNTYMRKLGLNTVTQIICRWAPPTENNTDAYVKKVCEISGLDPIEPLSFWNSKQMLALVRGMAYVENGRIIDGDSIREGYKMAGGIET